ncbi:MAG: hypothetical protein QOJ29_5040 [Thermoleophilaceae bacterium]|jgi:hypothetical protein|nr:hypothetical protein [Thermoleophilaceae bacterium]
MTADARSFDPGGSRQQRFTAFANATGSDGSGFRYKYTA